MKNSIMRDAVGCIGDDLISAADEKKVAEHFSVKRRRVKGIAAVGGLAACLIIAVIINLPFVSLELYTNQESEKALPTTAVENVSEGEITNSLFYTETIANSDIKFFNVGDESEGKHGKLKYISSSDNKVSFLLEKQDSDDVVFVFDGCYDTVSGELITRTAFFAASTSLTEKKTTVDLSDKLKVYVNGSLIAGNSLPTAPGRYEITIDFSELSTGEYELYGSFYVTGFGKFCY